MILQIALDTPLRRVFDYRPPAEHPGLGEQGAPLPGVRVRVPFGRRQVDRNSGGIASKSAIDSGKLKSAIEILDRQPILDPHTFDLLLWAAEYYHHPLGEVFAAALPVSLRSGQPARQRTEWWSVTDSGRREFDAPSDRRAPQQRALLAWLAQRRGAGADDMAEIFKPAQWRSVEARGWIRRDEEAPRTPGAGSGTAPAPAPGPGPAPIMAPAAMEVLPGEVGLTEHQAHCVAAILASLPGLPPICCMA